MNPFPQPDPARRMPPPMEDTYFMTEDDLRRHRQILAVIVVAPMLCLLVVLLAPVACTMHERETLREMVKAGADPIAANCAMGHSGRLSSAACVEAARRQEAK